MELITAAELAEYFGRSTDIILSAAAKAGLTSMPVKYGKGTMAVFQKDEALSALTPILKPPLAAPSAAVDAVPATVFAASIERMESRLMQAVEANGGECEQRMERMLGLAQKLTDQNVLLLRAMNDLRTDVLNRMNALQETFDHRTPEPIPDTPPPATIVPKVPTSAIAKKKRVGIVCLLDAQKAMIEREFGSVFDLRIVNSDDQRKGTRLESAVGNCDVVLAMTNFLTHSTEASIRASGAKVIRINGGMTALRERLTTLFVETEDAARAGA